LSLGNFNQFASQSTFHLTDKWLDPNFGSLDPQ